VERRWSLVVSKRRKETLIANWPLRCCFHRSVWFGVRRDCGFYGPFSERTPVRLPIGKA